MIPSNRSSVFRGAFLTVSTRWLDRVIGMISTLILARLLLPEDFGIIAMSSLVIGLVDVLLDLGVNVALVQNRQATQTHFDTAWTLRLIQTSLTTAVVILVAPLAGDYFGDPRVVPVLQVMALGLILAGLENIGVVDFQKQMQFGLEFRYLFLKRLTGFLTTVAAAWFLRSYWALVIGALTGRSLGVLLSYLMHPMRPRFSLEKLGEIFAVSQWMLVRGIGNYLNANLHRFLVGNRADTATMGGYSLANEIASMPSTELLAPLNRALFPAFVKARERAGELKRLFLLAQGVQSLVAIPAGVGLALVAHEAVLVLLGARWMLAVPFVQILALTNVAAAIMTSGSYVMITMGEVRNVALLTWANVAIFAVGAFVLLPGGDALSLAWLRMASVLVGLLLALLLLMRALPDLRFTDIAGTAYRPLAAAAIMSAAVLSLPNLAGQPAVSALLLKIGAGLVSYAAIIMLLWWLAGRPDSAERYLLDKARAIFRRRRKPTDG